MKKINIWNVNICVHFSLELLSKHNNDYNTFLYLYIFTVLWWISKHSTNKIILIYRSSYFYLTKLYILQKK